MLKVPNRTDREVTVSEKIPKTTTEFNLGALYGCAMSHEKGNLFIKIEK